MGDPGQLWKEIHINVLELEAAKYAILTFTRMYPMVKSIYIQMDNIVAISYLVKMAEVHKKTLNYPEQGNMGVFTGKGDHDYCAVPSRSSEKGSRFSVQNCEGFKRVEANTASISSICQEWGKSVETICLLKTSSLGN